MTARRVPGAATALALAVWSLAAGCSTDGRELADPVFPLPATVPASVPPDTVDSGAFDDLPAEPLPSAPETEPSGRVVIDRLSSPANATAEVIGTGALPGDQVSVDGLPADVVSFVVEPDGSFTVQVRIEDEGAHTVCVADTCGRVFTLAPDAETPEEVVAKIDEAIVLAAEILPYDELFPDWTIEIGGALSGTGGTTDAERRVVTVYRNRGRTVDDFVRTILHEYGHVVDTERLDDDARAEYLRLAGYPEGTSWSDPAARRLDDWARQPAEDFAEVLVAVWSDGRWLPRTRTDVSGDLLAATAALAGFAGG
ncbi:MAG: hypothetical protein ACLGHQ_00620 [Acidimicrobiia bacterium]